VRASRVGQKERGTFEATIVDPEGARAVGIDLDELFAAVDDAKSIEPDAGHIGTVSGGET
jgi:hypothetical protein